MEKKQPHDERISISFPADLLAVIRKRAKANDRSVNKEVIRMLRTLLQQEQEKGEPGHS